MDELLSRAIASKLSAQIAFLMRQMAYSAMPGVAEATSQSMKTPPGLRFRSPKGFHVLSRGFIPVRNREKSLKTDLDAIALSC
jgi:hypothetical protein